MTQTPERGSDLAATQGGFTEDELREAIAYIRSLPVGRRWRILPRQERYGPSPVLMSWVSHAEDLLGELARLRAELNGSEAQA